MWKRFSFLLMCINILVQNLTFVIRKKVACIAFLCAAALVSNMLTFLSGGKHLNCFLSVSAFLVNIWALSSGERDCQYFCFSAACLTKTCAFLLEERDSQYRFTAAEFVFKFCLKKHSACFFYLSWCLCAENVCNLHAIIAILLIFLHKYLVFLLRPSSLIYIIDWKTSQCHFSWIKRSRHKNQIAMTSDCYAQRPIECSTDKDWVIKNR